MADRYPSGLIDLLTWQRFSGVPAAADLARDGEGWVVTAEGVLAEPARATANAVPATAYGSGVVNIAATPAQATASAKSAGVGLNVRAAPASAIASAVSGGIDPLPPSAWRKRFRSFFPGGTMQQLPHGHTITESGGLLTASVAATANAEWWTSIFNAPLAWEHAHVLETAFDTVYKLEARCSALTYSNNNCMNLLALYNDGQNAYWMGWYPNNTSVYVQRGIANSFGDLNNHTGKSGPSTSPHTYRMYFNPTARPLYVEESDGLSLTVNAGEIQFWYKVGDAGTWTLLHSRTMELSYSGLHFGVGVRNWGSPYPSTSTNWSFILVYQWNAAKQIFVPANDPVPLTNTAVDPRDRMGLEDSGGSLTLGGPPAFDSPDQMGGGMDLKGPRAAFEDAGGVLSQSGQPLGYMPDGLDGGSTLTSKPMALEDSYQFFLSLLPEFSTATQDVDGHYHFTYIQPYIAFPYNTAGEAWADPTHTSFTGYARDGYKYTNGVKDAGPVSAPWRSEASSANRSSRGDFPVQSLIVATQRELVIFDMDTYDGVPANLRVWMRFLLGNDGSNFLGLGRGVGSIRSVSMANGLLAVGTQDTGWEGGGLHTIDFRATTSAATFNLVRSDGQWVGNSSKTIVDRNTNSCYASSGSYRLEPEKVYSLSMWVEGTTTYIAVAGEDPSPQIVKFSMNTIQAVTNAQGDDIGAYDIGDYRQVYFDDVGWLWFSIGSRLYRNCKDWREGYVWPKADDRRQGSVDLGVAITKIVAAGENVYCATSRGVYCVPKGSLAAFLAYTIAGGGGGGRLNSPPAGEILAGTTSDILALRSYTLLLNSVVIPYLVVGTWWGQANNGGLTLIRVFDDVVSKSMAWPDLIEPGTLMATVMMV